MEVKVRVSSFEGRKCIYAVHFLDLDNMYEPCASKLIKEVLRANISFFNLSFKLKLGDMLSNEYYAVL